MPIHSAESETVIEGLPITGRAWKVLLELLVGYGLIVLVIWTSRPLHRYLFWAAVGWVVLATCVSFDGLRTMGVSVVDFRRSLWVVGGAVLAAMIAVAVGRMVGTLHPPRGGVATFVGSFWGYCIWAFFQQFLLHNFMLLRLMRLLTVRYAVVVTAGLFALVHLPNPILTPLTLAWGIAACALFLRYRNLYTLAAVHAILGITVSITVPSDLIHSMRVGLGYLAYRPHVTHVAQRLPR